MNSIEIFNIKKYLGLLTILLYSLCFLGLLVLLQTHSVLPTDFFLFNSDSKEYAILAHNLLSRGEFIQPQLVPLVPEFLRTPGYPLFLAAIMAVFSSYFFVILVQIFLVAGSAICIFEIGRHFVSPWIATLAASLYVLDPTTVFHAFVAMSESLFIFLFLLAFLFCLDGLLVKDKKAFRKVLLAGLFFGLATIVRPIALYVLPVIVFGYAIYWYWQRDTKKIIFKILLLIIGFTLMISPLLIRNYRLSGHVGLSSVGQYNLLFYNMTEYLSVKSGKSPATIRTGLMSELGNPPVSTIRSFQYTDLYTQKVNQIFWSDPVGYLRFHLIKTIPFFVSSSFQSITAVFQNPSLALIPSSASQQINMTNLLLSGSIKEFSSALINRPIFTLEQLAWLLLLFGVVVGFFFHRKEKLFFAGWCGLLILEVALLTGPVSFPRYRLAVEPFILLLGLAGLMALGQKILDWVKKNYPDFFNLIINFLTKIKGEFLRYLVVGGLAFVVDYGFLVILVKFFNWNYLWAATLSFILGLVVNYLLSIKWVFKNQQLKNRWAEFIIFSSIGLIGLGINDVFLWLLTDGLGIHYTFSKLVVAVVVLLWNFIIRKVILFR